MEDEGIYGPLNRSKGGWLLLGCFFHWKYSFWPVEYDAKKFGALVNEFLASEAAN